MMNTLDWEKLERFVEERHPKEVSAGILNDWFWTAATVYENGEWKDRSRAYVTSSWATPGFKAELPNGDVVEVVAYREEREDEAKTRAEESSKNREALHKLAEEIRAKNGA